MPLMQDHSVLPRSNESAKTFAAFTKWSDWLKLVVLTDVSFQLVHLLPAEGCSKWKKSPILGDLKY